MSTHVNRILFVLELHVKYTVEVVPLYMYILVIQTFYPSTISVLYNKDVYPTSSIV